MSKNSGNVVGVYGSVVDVQFPLERLPEVYEIVTTKTYHGKNVVLEVLEHHAGNICRCIALTSTYGLQRNSQCLADGTVLSVPMGKELYGRVINVMGDPIDNKGPLDKLERIKIRGNQTRRDRSFAVKEGASLKFEIMETGIKLIDLLFPLVKGSKTGILGGAALGKTILILEIINNIITKSKGTAIFTGVGERVREGNELYYELEQKDLLKRSFLVYGQMNEPPGARFETAQVGVSIAEAFLNKGEDVLFFVDNVFRFVQAGAELSALLGRIPSETGYQPTLISEISDFHERIRSAEHAAITAIEAVYVPADDLTDPAVVAIFSHLDSLLVLSRDYVQRGLYPSIDPLYSSTGFISPDIVGRKHFDINQEVIKYFQKFNELQRIVSIIGKEELSQQERKIFERARKLQLFLTQPFFTAEEYTGRKGVYVPLEETLAGCYQIIAGRCDSVPEDKFYMIGALDITGS